MNLIPVAILSAAFAARAASELVPLNDGARLVARYETNAAPMKPYLKELFSPSGVQVTVDSPPDHFHHHGLMFAIGAGDVDFWSEKPFEQFGKQVPRAGETKIFANGLKQKLAWVGTNGTPLLAESREVRLQAVGPGEPNIVTWVSVLEPTGTATAHLWGRHYFGLGLRFPADMDEKAAFILPEGTAAGHVVRSDEALRAAAWCAASGTIGGKPVTVAMWDSPQNARRAVWFTMTKPFSYMSATLNLEAEPLALKSGEGLLLRYGLAIFDGIADAAKIEKARATWLAAQGQSQMENAK